MTYLLNLPTVLATPYVTPVILRKKYNIPLSIALKLRRICDDDVTLDKRL